MVKFKLIAHFPENYLPHPIASRLILALLSFAAFAYVLDRFVSVTIYPIFAILLRLVCSCSDIVLWALFCAAITRYSVPLLRFYFLSPMKVFSWEISVVCRLRCPYSCLSSRLCFLVIFVLLMLVMRVWFQAAKINLPPRFLM